MNFIDIDLSPSYICEINFNCEIFLKNKAFLNKWGNIGNIVECLSQSCYQSLLKNIKDKKRDFLLVSIVDKKNIKEVIQWNFYKKENDIYLCLGDEKTVTNTLFSRIKSNQKFEVLGQMATGIAHEINTPSQYILNNLSFLKKLQSNINENLKEIELTDSDDKLVSKLKDVCKKNNEILDIVNESEVGILRITDIVKAMRDFSYTTDVCEKSLNSIYYGLNSTITISRNEWKYKCELISNVDNNLPLINCNIGRINQVFLNLILNGVHAIDEAVKKGKYKKGKIIISAEYDDDYLTISFKDDALGIPDNIKSKIFDSFFTTKKIGVGTGQGLHISKDIVENIHKGELTFKTKVNIGTTFFVRLPRKNINLNKQ